jgi:AAA+ superfamily predicted ATPase
MNVFHHALNLVRAGARVLHIASFEWERVHALAVYLAHQNLRVPLRVWSSSAGLQQCDERGILQPADDRLSDPLEAMKRLAEADEGGVLLLEDIHPYLEPQHHQVTRQVRQMCRLPSQPARLLLLATPLPFLPVDLGKEVPTIELPLPGVDVLRTALEEVADNLQVALDQDPALTEAARGLTIMEARLAFGQAALQHKQLDRGAVPFVIREKERVIKQSGVLEYYEPDAAMDDVGGLRNLKGWLERRGRAYDHGAHDFGLDAPRGLLLLGVQGCGKSLVAKAIASAWQFPLLRFDMGKVFGGIVGQSEGNMRTALQVAQALAPCVLWIDEIEKGLAGMGSSDRSDGGITARVVGTLLTWMQEKREPVFVVATANRIDMLPPELLRKGRFDDIFFVDLPSRAVREEILAIHLRKKKRDPAQFDLARLAERSLGYSGAELEGAVGEALFDAFAGGRELTTEDVEGALRATFPLSRTMRDEIQNLRRWAEARARLASDEKAESLPAGDGAAVPRLRQETRNSFIPGATP